MVQPLKSKLHGFPHEYILHCNHHKRQIKYSTHISCSNVFPPKRNSLEKKWLIKGEKVETNFTKKIHEITVDFYLCAPGSSDSAPRSLQERYSVTFFRGERIYLICHVHGCLTSRDHAILVLGSSCVRGTNERDCSNERKDIRTIEYH